MTEGVAEYLETLGSHAVLRAIVTFEAVTKKKDSEFYRFLCLGAEFCAQQNGLGYTLMLASDK